MEFEKDQFEDDDELSRLEDDEELGGESGNIIEEEAEILSVEEEPAEEAPTARLAPKAMSMEPGAPQSLPSQMASRLTRAGMFMFPTLEWPSLRFQPQASAPPLFLHVCSTGRPSGK